MSEVKDLHQSFNNIFGMENKYDSYVAGKRKVVNILLQVYA